VISHKRNREKELKTIICILLTLSFSSIAQSLFDVGKPSFQRMFSYLDSSSTVVMAIGQDSKGKIWIGGDFGLKVFTGYKYINIPKISGFKINKVRSLYIDKNDSVWVGTRKNGVLLLPQDDRFSQNHFSPKNSKISGNYIRSIIGDKKGKIWFATENGLSEYDSSVQVISNIELKSFPDASTVTKVRDLAYRDNVVWAATTHGLAKYKVSPDTSAELVFTSFTGDISAIEVTRKKDIWLGKTDGTVFLKQSISEKFINLELTSKLSSKQHFRINDIVSLSDQEIGIATNNSGLIVINPEGDSIKQHYNLRIGGEVVMEHKFLEKLFVDRNKMVWIAGKKGIATLSSDRRSQTLITEENSPDSFLKSNDIGAIVQADNGDIFIGQRNGSVAYFSSNKEKKYQNLVDELNRTLRNKAIVSMLIASERIYIGTTDSYLYVGEFANSKVLQLNQEHGLPDWHIRSLYKDSYNRVWMGTSTGGVIFFEGKSILFLNADKKIFKSQINGIHESEEGNMWLATSDGLFMIKSGEAIAKKYEVNGKREQEVESVFFDSRNRLWVGYGKEVYYSDNNLNNEPIFQSFNQKLGLGEKSLGQNFVELPNGMILSEDGILDPVNFKFSEFSNNAFINIKKAYWNTTLLLKDGTTVFGSDSGVSILKADLLKPNYKIAKPYLESYSLDTKEFLLPSSKLIEVASNIKFLKLAFNAYDYESTRQLRFKYKLEGLNDDWIHTNGGSREIVFSNLYPGSYTLKVLVASRYSIWGKPETIAQITIKPKWHQILWVRFSISLLTILVFFHLYKLRVKKLQNQQKVLEREVDDRTIELRSKNDELIEKNKEIEHLANHDALTSLPTLRLCLDRIENAIKKATRTNEKLALLYLDLDGFKAVNDTFGHEAGDEILKFASSKMLSCVRECDTVARIGGDEFLIILSEVNDIADIQKTCERLINTIDTPYLYDDKNLTVGISIGASIFPTDGEDSESLKNKADEMMYKVKKSGKNNYLISTMNKVSS